MSWCLYQLTRRAWNTLPRLAGALPASVFVGARWGSASKRFCRVGIWWVPACFFTSNPDTRTRTLQVHPGVLRLLSFRFTECLLGAPALTCLVGSMENGSQNAREIRSQNAAKLSVIGSKTNGRMALHGRAAPDPKKPPPKLNSNWTQTPIGLQH
jgi:hypothetical protein